MSLSLYLFPRYSRPWRFQVSREENSIYAYVSLLRYRCQVCPGGRHRVCVWCMMSARRVATTQGRHRRRRGFVCFAIYPVVAQWTRLAVARRNRMQIAAWIRVRRARICSVNRTRKNISGDGTMRRAMLLEWMAMNCLNFSLINCNNSVV